jgi:hypothetical protein
MSTLHDRPATAQTAQTAQRNEAKQMSDSPTEPGSDVAKSVSPVVAAAFLAGVVYMWGEAAFRLAFTYNANFDAFWVLWQGRVGDIAAMWLTISGVALVVFYLFGYLVFRGRQALGSITFWTILLIVSAIVAPLIGEIGTPIGI